jgi:alanyl-tRNA synthetase
LRSDEIRKSFLDYFKERGHLVVPSSSLVPDDPTLLLTNAGMVQFKPYFLGNAKPSSTRAVSCQKCIRTKDIERVGRTARHLTFFEMLGNFSFGDYYKEEAIPWAWEFLTSYMGLDPGRMYCSVFREDEEAYLIWRDKVGVPESRLVRLGEEDNFWDMGTTGPCGPCSEIIYDLGEEFGCGREDCGPGCDCDRYLELWNLVFMQYHRDEKGKLHPLPSKNIDTGLGLERIASILQGARDNFGVDLLAPVLEKAADLAGVKPGSDERADVSLKIITDHSRAVTFLVGDGVLPSNEDRGYVLRRLIRRAVRHGRLLGIGDMFLSSMAEAVIEVMGEAYPDLRQNHAFIASVIDSEEERFSQTLRAGLNYFREAVENLRSRGEKRMSGSVAFYLHDTLGFPLELTRELAEEEGLELDEATFRQLMEEQKRRAREARAEEGYEDRVPGIYREIQEKIGKTRFIGYETMNGKARVAAVIKGNKAVPRLGAGEEGEVFLDVTPFYGEMGGQVGDRGRLVYPGGEAEVTDTLRAGEELVSHRVKVLRGGLEVGTFVEAEVDARRRMDVMRNHTATHLLHWALRQVLGEHAKQAGSLVEPERFRFDFTHPRPLTREELGKIEEMVNEKIMENHPVRAFITTLDYARSIEAVALFGEKYGEYVRVVEVDEISRELCGGTHVDRTGCIGQMVITGESGIGAGMRRIESVTGIHAYRYMAGKRRLLEEIAASLKVDVEGVPRRLEKMRERIRELEEELRRREREAVAGLLKGGLAWKEVSTPTGKILIGEAEGLKTAEMRETAERALDRRRAAVVILGSRGEEKAEVVVKVSRDLADAGMDAVKLVKAAGVVLEGGGGGRPDLASGGGSRKEKLTEALQAAVEEALARFKDHAT